MSVGVLHILCHRIAEVAALKLQYFKHETHGAWQLEVTVTERIMLWKVNDINGILKTC